MYPEKFIQDNVVVPFLLFSRCHCTNCFYYLAVVIAPTAALFSVSAQFRH